MKVRAVVVDTNVVVAGLLTRDPESPTARILDRMLRGELPFLLSTRLVAEYRTVLLRETIRARHGLDDDEIDRILATLAANGIVREPTARAASGPSAEDQHLWDLLACEPHSILITGDRLLVATPPGDARVVTPAGFFEPGIAAT